MDQELLREIDGFLEQSGIAETTFGRLSVNDGKFVQRIRSGGRVWPETAEKVRDFIRSRSTQEAAQ